MANSLMDALNALSIRYYEKSTRLDGRIQYVVYGLTFEERQQLHVRPDGWAYRSLASFAEDTATYVLDIHSAASLEWQLHAWQYRLRQTLAA